MTVNYLRLDLLNRNQGKNSLIFVCVFLLASSCCIATSTASNNDACTLNNEGVRAINAGNIPLAIKKLEEALSADSSYSLATQNLSIAYNNYGLLLKDQPQKAIKQFHRAVYLDHDNAATKGNLDGIITMLKKDPKLFKDRVVLGDEANKSGDFVGAIVEYESALSINDDPAIRQKLATAQTQNKKHPIFKATTEKSSAAHAKEIDFGPYMTSLQAQIKSHWSPPLEDRSKRLVVLFKIHRDGKLSDLVIDCSSGLARADQAALNAVKSAAPFAALPAGAAENVDIQFTFDYNAFHTGKGITTTTALLSVDQWRHSTESRLQNDLTRAEASKPSDNMLIASALVNLANYYKKIGNWESADSKYDRALKLRETALGTENPLVASTLVDMGESKYLQGKYDEAESLLLRALAIEDKPEIHDNVALDSALETYAKVLYKLNRASEANKIYSRLSQLRAVSKPKPSGDSGNVANSFQKAVKEYNKKDFNAALALFLQAHKEKPQDPNVLFYLGNCYFSLKQRDSGLKTYWTLISNFPDTLKSKQAIAYLKQIAPDFLQKQQQKTGIKIPASEPSESNGVKQEKNTNRDYSADDVMIVLKGSGERQDCPPQLVSALKATFDRFPKGVRYLLGSRGCKIYITPSTIEKDPRLQNTRPRGYEDGTTWKNCPGYSYGREVVICAYVMAHDESGWIAADDPISTLRHETGHEIDYLMGQCSEHEEYKHGFLLDVGAMDEETKQTLAYYTQVADAGPHESFAEITCCLLGGATTKGRMAMQTLVVQNFPRSVKYVSQLIQSSNLGK